MYFLEIDLRTGFKLIVSASLTVAALMFLYRHEKGSKRALTLFASAQLLKAIGMVLIILRGAIYLLLSAHLGNALIYVGVALEMFAFALISPSRLRIKTLFATIPVVGVVLFGIVDFLPPFPANSGSRYALISSLVVGSLYGAGGIGLLRAERPSQLRKVLGVMFVALALCFFGRAYTAVAQDLEMFTPNVLQSLTAQIWLVVTIVCGLGFILVINEDANRALQLATITDPLTMLANRRRFDEVLNCEYSRLKRSGAPLSLIMVDVDHFKGFNDRYGHVQGDECLRRVGQAIRTAVNRSSDLAARFGGEEFVVVAPETDAAGARTLAEGIRRAVEELAIVHDGNTAASHVTVSLGVVTRYATELETPEAFVSLADQALYRAKEAGRNRTEVMRRQQDEISRGPGLVRLVWKDIDESGNTQLDDEHKALFGHANLLLSAVLEDRPKQECKALLDQMLETVVVHFKDEEALLARTSFPDTEHHIRCHKALVAKALDMSERFDRNELSVGELFSFLAHEVVAQHVFCEDRKFFPYLSAVPHQSDSPTRPHLLIQNANV